MPVFGDAKVKFREGKMDISENPRADIRVHHFISDISG
jgi:hypothetical protein